LSTTGYSQVYNLFLPGLVLILPVKGVAMMFSRFTPAKAGVAALTVLGFLFLFHLCVLLGLLPDGVVWGGSVSGEDAVTMEIVALLITVLFAMVAAGRAGLILRTIPGWVFAAGSWVMTVYFLFNTAGNLFSASSTERAVFLPVSVVLFFLSLFLAVKGNER